MGILFPPQMEEYTQWVVKVNILRGYFYQLYLQKVLFITGHTVNIILGCAGVMKLASDCVVEDSHFM